MSYTKSNEGKAILSVERGVGGYQLMCDGKPVLLAGNAKGLLELENPDADEWDGMTAKPSPKRLRLTADVMFDLSN